MGRREQEGCGRTLEGRTYDAMPQAPSDPTMERHLPTDSLRLRVRVDRGLLDRLKHNSSVQVVDTDLGVFVGGGVHFDQPLGYRFTSAGLDKLCLESIARDLPKTNRLSEDLAMMSAISLQDRSSGPTPATLSSATIFPTPG